MTNCEVQIYIKKTQELFSNFETVVTFTCVQFKNKNFARTKLITGSQ